MPRHPKVASSLADIGGSVYSALAHRMATFEGEVYPLQVGDTWLEPAEGCRMQDLRVDDHPGMHRYAPPQGILALIDAIVERARARMGVPTERRNVLVTAGATGGLGAVARAIVEPGDEVLLLAPYWPLIRGIVRCSHGTPVDVPFVGAADSAESAVELARRHRTPRTVALYINTPNNPSGRVIPPEWVHALVAWAAREDLWILSDEVYEDYVYQGEHVYCRALAPERTLSVHSFSKAFGMAGNRCGYVLGPVETILEIRKVSMHSIYNTPTASQIAARRALDGHGDAWIERVKPLYRKMGDDSARRLGVPAPQGSTFLFFDVARALDERGLAGFLDRCADRGLFVAPGPSFGPYPTHIRVCFTAAAPDIVERGVGVLASILGR
ncbi:MAG: pyridoxal phosphate-dependent aminotransferase [Candidatus Krumholzibacteriia bacterium]